MMQQPIYLEQKCFDLYELTAELPTFGGVYIFTQLKVDLNQYPILYIGKADDFYERLQPGSHEKWSTAIELGMTHLGLCEIGDSTERKEFEKLLIMNYPTPLNH